MIQYLAISSLLKFRLYIFCYFLLIFSATSADQMAIFFPINVSSRQIKSNFRQDKNYGKYRPVVFSKVKELLKVNKSKQYDYVLATESFFQFNPAYRKKFVFQRDDKDQFQFKIVSLLPDLNENDLKKGVIALVDVTKRKHLKSYMSGLLDQLSFRKIKRVSKVEDLFPILVFNNAQFILVRPQNLLQLRAEYSSPIYEVGTSKLESFPSIGVHKNSSFNKLEKPSLSIIKQLGFTSVKEITRGQK
ncbi:hypothetical protein MJH12_16980 [bacterium]|nr:hypothetical protein [bacterium]